MKLFCGGFSLFETIVWHADLECKNLELFKITKSFIALGNYFGLMLMLLSLVIRNLLPAQWGEILCEAAFLFIYTSVS